MLKPLWEHLNNLIKNTDSTNDNVLYLTIGNFPAIVIKRTTLGLGQLISALYNYENGKWLFKMFIPSRELREMFDGYYRTVNLKITDVDKMFNVDYVNVHRLIQRLNEDIEKRIVTKKVDITCLSPS